MPVDYCQSKYYIGFAVTVMTGANAEPENRQFSIEKLHDIKKIFVAVIYFCRVPFSSRWLLLFCRFTKAMTFPRIK